MDNITPQHLAIQHQQKEDENKLVISYLALRRWVGYLGIMLPIILILASYLLPHCTGFQNSVSDYHNTISRDLFVGILCAIALFLSAYNGYNTLDMVVSKVAGILGFVVAIFPTDVDTTVCSIYSHLNCNDAFCFNFPAWVGTLHLISAAIFLLLLAYFSFFFFTKSDIPKEFRPPRKKIRNRIYRTCGIIIALCVVILGFYFLPFFDAWRDELNGRYKVVLVFEWIALWAFGFSWMVKGEAILKDK